MKIAMQTDYAMANIIGLDKKSLAFASVIKLGQG